MTAYARIRILRVGPLTQVQDWGRFGHQVAGVTRGGPLDEHAWAWANHLLGNPWNSVAIEIHAAPMALTVDQDRRFCVCGGGFAPWVDGERRSPWRTFLLRGGQLLELRGGEPGMRCYLAAEGGFRVRRLLGSAATVSREQLDGMQEGILETGAEIEVGAAGSFTPWSRFVPPDWVPDYAAPVTLDWVPCSGWFDLPESTREAFEAARFEVTASMDRMACRLRGADISGFPNGIVSEGIQRGTIQMLPGGQPMIMLNDHPTMGGYCKIGVVTARSCDQLVQCRPGSTVDFRAFSLVKAQHERSAFLRFFRGGVDFDPLAEVIAVND
jgi:5-oxoprolinase (ATP-hydrolysing) subunit C